MEKPTNTTAPINQDQATPERRLETAELVSAIKQWGHELGFQQIGISDLNLSATEQYLQQWLAQKFHGQMEYMSRHGTRRTRPAELIPGSISIITARMDYMSAAAQDMVTTLDDTQSAYVSRYALGRDYHKVIRSRLAKLCQQIEQVIGSFGYRVFSDSAPVMEKPIAQKAGLGWIGKHTNLIHRQAGSWFFLGEIYTDLHLPSDQQTSNHCGSCRRCIDICPTQAIVAPYQLDARRCISYLTIELDGSIPEPFRKAIGNRIYGCDDCQIICPWNRYAKFTQESDFDPRHQLDQARLCELFAWSEEEFLHRMQGSPIRRIGYTRWLRNIAVALGNAVTTSEVQKALSLHEQHPDPIVREHVQWAIAQHRAVTPAAEIDAEKNTHSSGFKPFSSALAAAQLKGRSFKKALRRKT